eukprot:Blabericola_migrator_1__1672@NODE_144_length_13005_cov_119_784279_g125_i0_p4_GENE_NODE_144_length_13005_cov_119_784279_g125_i0NODE_144_length_13005_cov_119_784279_g125_i0_p4_ORF_typecomplete_len510_score77_71MBOAT/PF03062_19/4_1e35MBOAT_2/PF13813_6/6_3e03MBOAT_2/PF13813_6/0_00086_NODE_144_length_13005_cov_119_784279_g125_i070968625
MSAQGDGITTSCCTTASGDFADMKSPPFGLRRRGRSDGDKDLYRKSDRSDEDETINSTAPTECSPGSVVSDASGAPVKARDPGDKKPKLLVKVVPRHQAVSMLDICDSNSMVSKSNFRGIVVLAHVLCGVTLVANPVYSLFETGSPVDFTLADSMFSDFALLMTAWVLAFSWSFTSFGLFKAMKARLISTRAVIAGQHLTQVLLILGMIALARGRAWTIFPSTFVATVAMLHYMKMHSFVSCTIDLFENATDADKEDPACDIGRISLQSFAKFLICPVLVYTHEYPKDPHGFRVGYFITKAVCLVGTLALIYTVASQMVIPVFASSDRVNPGWVMRDWARLVVPLILMDFLFFYMMFECILNMLAEITQWGDRHFYDDWWNCTTWDDFARKWNKPVHEFLWCHVYIFALKVSKIQFGHKKSKWAANFTTFLFSAILHETFLAATIGVVRFYMFTMMLCQLPLMALSKFHKNTTFGNYYFWFGLVLGVPFLSTMYGRDWAMLQVWPSSTD